MCGKASLYHITWEQIYGYATTLNSPETLPPDPQSKINVSPSRLRRKSEPDSMVWETLPVIWSDGEFHQPAEAIWPFLPAWSHGHLPTNKDGKLISTANARLRKEGAPFAPTFMPAWKSGFRVLVATRWFYEFDSRVKPQIPYAVFPLDSPLWLMAGLARRVKLPDGSIHLTTTIITVDPNEVLKSVGHHRSPALLRDGNEALQWLEGNETDALNLLRPFENETMGVEAIPNGIKIPGNQDVEIPPVLTEKKDFRA